MKRTFLLIGLAILICASTTAQNSRQGSSEAVVQPNPKLNYSRWLNEDVVYIITPLEKRAFLRLSSDDQRERFIEQFWRARNPNPASRENQYRAEHYSRIAFANHNYASGDLPGWRTDRGRIYVTYGKPDQVQRSPSKEVWVYSFLPGLGRDVTFKFVDNSDRHEFHLQP